MYKIYFPEAKKNFTELDDFAYDVIYKKELGPKTPSKLMSSWREGYNMLSVRIAESGLLVAMGMLQKPKRNIDCLHIEHIGVRQDYRDRQLGTLVVNTLIEHAKEAKAKRVKLKSLQESVEFYKRLGFTEYDKTMHLMERLT